MRSLARLVLAGSCALALLAHPVAASSQDSTAANSASNTPARGSIALATFRVGVRLATTVRFPTGLGLALAVCTAGLVLEIDDYLRSR